MKPVKKIIVTIILAASVINLAACANQNKITETEPSEKPTMATSTPAPTPTPASPKVKTQAELKLEFEQKYKGLVTAKNEDINIYQNDHLGISFEYPAEWGKIEESGYKMIELGYLRFSKIDNAMGHIEISKTDPDYLPAMRTCDDILENGFNDGDIRPTKCEESVVFPGKIVVLTFTEGGKSNSYTTDNKGALVETNDGIWVINTMNTELYPQVEKIIASLEIN